jgi:hypothetical protein
VKAEILQVALSDHDLPPVEWKDVKQQLFDAANRIRVRRVNGSAKDALDYSDHSGGLSVIAIGGDKLSRGLTLEGLSISYFIRTSKMYDTLMQMGRWFGFRPGYADLCRLYTTAELQRWYKDTALANEDLLVQFEEMALTGQEPKAFGLRVRQSADRLVVTAAGQPPRRKAPPVARSGPSACRTAGGCPAAGERRHELGSCAASARLKKQCDAPESKGHSVSRRRPAGVTSQP